MIIPEDLYKQICQAMPIPCVDLLVSDESGFVLLLKRKNEPSKRQWWFPGGRVHFNETRQIAAIRKLKEECGLDAVGMKEIGTYDIMLEISSDGFLSHGITTLFLIHVKERGTLKLDDQTVAADWHTPKEWKKRNLHPFVRDGLSILDNSKR